MILFQPHWYTGLGCLNWVLLLALLLGVIPFPYFGPPPSLVDPQPQQSPPCVPQTHQKGCDLIAMAAEGLLHRSQKVGTEPGRLAVVSHISKGTGTPIG